MRKFECISVYLYGIHRLVHELVVNRGESCNLKSKDKALELEFYTGWLSPSLTFLSSY
jgi:hypothetical protein